MPDEKDRIIQDAIEALRANADGLNTRGFEKWAQMTDKIADHLERRNVALKSVAA